MDKISHDHVHLRLNTTCIKRAITKRRVRWLGHVLRPTPRGLAHLLDPALGGVKRGELIETWIDTVRKDFETYISKVNHHYMDSEDRKRNGFYFFFNDGIRSRRLKRLTLVIIGYSLTTNGVSC